jgi:hypothetical protein
MKKYVIVYDDTFNYKIHVFLVISSYVAISGYKNTQ